VKVDAVIFSTPTIVPIDTRSHWDADLLRYQMFLPSIPAAKSLTSWIAVSKNRLMQVFAIRDRLNIVTQVDPAAVPLLDGRA
jgi:hypothetical protein